MFDFDGDSLNDFLVTDSKAGAGRNLLARVQRMIALRCRDWRTSRMRRRRVTCGYGSNSGAQKCWPGFRCSRRRELGTKPPAACASSWRPPGTIRTPAGSSGSRCGPAGRTEQARKWNNSWPRLAHRASLLALGRACLAERDLDRAWEAGLRAKELGASYPAFGKVNIQQFFSEVAARRSDPAAARAIRHAASRIARISLADNEVPNRTSSS